MFKKNFCTLFFLSVAAVLIALPQHQGTVNYKASSIQNLKINLSWEDVQLEQTNGSDIVVEIYSSRKKYTPIVKTNSDSLIIQTNPEGKALILNEKKLCTVVIKIPNGKNFKYYDLQTSSGNITGAVSFSAEVTVVTSSSGDISIIGGNSKSTTMTASSGDISCSNFSGGETVFQTSSGNIKLSDYYASSFKSSASSGNITAQNLGCQSFSVSTSSGTIGLELVDAPVFKSNVASSSGTQFISMPQGSQITLNVTTSSGSFINAFTREKLSSHANYNREINGGGPTVSFSSSSGTITLDVENGVSSGFSNKSGSFENEDIPVVIFEDAK